MSADFTYDYKMPDLSDASFMVARDWQDRTLHKMHLAGVTFVRVSHPPEDESRLYVEGWWQRPTDQGPHPWEADGAPEDPPKVRHPNLHTEDDS